jgi:Uma2 family endonuclease
MGDGRPFAVARTMTASRPRYAMTVKQLVTAEQFWEMPDIPGRQLELVEGEIVEMPTPGVIHNLIVSLLHHLLYTFAAERDLGLVFGDNTSYLLSQAPDTMRIPDVSLVLWEHVPEDGVPERFWSIPPDLAIEVVSPSDRASDVHDKVYEYLASGTQLVWVLWPTTRSVTVFGKGSANGEFGVDAELDGGDVLPGFRVRVTDLFNVRTKR